MSMSLIVSGVEEQYNVEYIANTFWNLNIAKVSSIILTSQGTAFVEIETWCDSEIAYNFIKRLNNVEKEARLVHYQDDWWVISKNNGQVFDFKGECDFATFDDDYFEKKINMRSLVNNFANELAIELAARRSQHVTIRKKCY